MRAKSTPTIPKNQRPLPGFKRCWKCQLVISVSAFRNEKRRGDGLRPECRSCEAVLRREHKQRDPGYQERMYPRYRDSAIARASKWQAENRERYNEIARAGYQRNIEERHAYHRGRRSERNAWQRKHYAKNRDKLRFINSEKEGRRRARIRATTSVPVDYEFIIERDGLICHICAGTVDCSDIHFDHVIPLSKGGAHSVENIKVAHSRCNLRKGAKIIA